ncbi:MAG: hypothetical protein ACE5NA_06680 [Nitrospiraceae bacterium]
MIVVNIVLLATGAFVVIVQGYNWFAVWDIMPLLGSAVLSEFTIASCGGEWAKTPLAPRLSIVVMVLAVVALTLYFHLSWLVPLDGTVSESATDGVVFILAPLYTLFGGGLGYGIGYAGGRMLTKATGPAQTTGVGPQS